MKREIKFRAWDGKKMLYSEKAQFYLMPDNKVDVPSSTGHEFYKRDYSVMQYTGLKDKEGEEIYEHDIILDHVSGKIWVVKFGQAWPYRFTGWYCDYKGEGVQAININNDADDDRNHATEIIGNIYENPELLK